MDIRKLMGLRPTNDTTSAIQAAQERAQAAHAEALARQEGARVHRDVMLMDGNAAELGKAQATLTEAREDVERTASIMTSLEQRLVAARRTETISGAETARAAYEKADADRVAWWKRTAPKLRDLIREGHQMEAALAQAGTDYHRAKSRLQEAYPDVGFRKADVAQQTDAAAWKDRVQTWREGNDLEGPAVREAGVRLQPTEPEAQPQPQRKAMAVLELDYQDLRRQG